MDIVKRIDEKFDDGSESVMLTAHEWYALRDLVAALKHENERLKWTLNTQD